MKFLITEETLFQIEKLATFKGSKTSNDIYYDFLNYRLTTNDMWLRERNNTFKLKRAIRRYDQTVSHYLNIIDETEILKTIGLEKEKNIFNSIKEKKLIPYANFQTIIRIYTLQNFTLVLDLAYFKEVIYRSLDIIPNNKKNTKKELLTLAKDLNINTNIKPQPKLIYYILKKNPSHYQILLKANIV